MPILMGTPVTVIDKDSSGTFRQRRRGGRFCAEVEAMLYEEGVEASGRAVMLTNVSLEGVCFRSPTPLALGSVHVIHLDVEYMWLNSRFEIVRCDRRDEDGVYEVGGEFVEDDEPAAPFGKVLGHGETD